MNSLWFLDFRHTVSHTGKGVLRIGNFDHTIAWGLSVCLSSHKLLCRHPVAKNRHCSRKKSFLLSKLPASKCPDSKFSNHWEVYICQRVQLVKYYQKIQVTYLYHSEKEEEGLNRSSGGNFGYRIARTKIVNVPESKTLLLARMKKLVKTVLIMGKKFWVHSEKILKKKNLKNIASMLG